MDKYCTRALITTLFAELCDWVETARQDRWRGIINKYKRDLFCFIFIAWVDILLTRRLLLLLYSAHSYPLHIVNPLTSASISYEITDHPMRPRFWSLNAKKQKRLIWSLSVLIWFDFVTVSRCLFAFEILLFVFKKVNHIVCRNMFEWRQRCRNSLCELRVCRIVMTGQVGDLLWQRGRHSP